MSEHTLHLQGEEVRPWLVLFYEQASQLEFPSGTPSEESIRKMFEELTLPLLRKMADSIFTPERLRQLVTDLRKYRSELRCRPKPYSFVPQL